MLQFSAKAFQNWFLGVFWTTYTKLQTICTATLEVVPSSSFK